MPVGDPEFSGTGVLQQRCNRDTLARVRVLTGHQVGHQAAVRVVHRQRVPRQGRTVEPAQGSKALLARRQVVTSSTRTRQPGRLASGRSAVITGPSGPALPRTSARRIAGPVWLTLHTMTPAIPAASSSAAPRRASKGAAPATPATPAWSAQLTRSER